LSDVAEWLDAAADKLERTAFDQVGVLRDDDDPVIVAIDSRAGVRGAEVRRLFQAATA
jgi:hypothetical protein